MTKRLLSAVSILALSMTVLASSNAQESKSASDLRGIDPGLAKQIARDKQLIEIWKDHVRTLKQERDEAYQRIEELKSAQVAELPAPVQDTAALEMALRQKEEALRESETLRSQITTLKTQISRLEVQGANQQYAVEVRPETPSQNPASQKFYADLSKNYMLQQASIKKLKEELAGYEEALSRIQALETEAADSKRAAEVIAAGSREFEAALARVNAENERLAADLESSRGLQNRITGLEGEKETIEKDYRQALKEIKEFDSEKNLLKQEITRLSKENQSLRKDYDEAVLEIEALNPRVRNAEDELQKTNANNRALQELIEKIKAEMSQLRDQKTAVDQAVQNLNLRLQDQTERSKELESGLRNALAQAEESTRRAEEVREDLTAQNDALKEKLNSNAADVKNLKENFETMLEPLVSSFDDRKKV